jgi:hypothetical protein
VRKHILETCAEGGQLIIAIALCALIIASVAVLYPIGTAVRMVRGLVR